MDIERCFFSPPFCPFEKHWTCQKSCFLIRRVLKKPFFYLTSLQGALFWQNKSQLSNLQNGHREMLFLTPHFCQFKKHWTCQKSCFLIRRVLKNLFFYLTFPQGALFWQNKSQLSNLQNGHREMLFLTPHFCQFKKHWICKKSCFLIRRVLKKPFFLSDFPQGALFWQNKSQLSNLQNGHGCFFSPHFAHLKSTGHVRNQVFSSEEC